ncbi:MAG: Gfo/Idh/MocA family protein [Planctomycetota bacterium]|jgi:predicted dehydrogenase
MSFRLGIIGAGSISQFHLAAAQRTGLTVAGVCDAEARRAERAARGWPGVEPVTRIEELLALDLAAVVVAVPNDLHKPMAVTALDAGLDVLLEKPMALDTAECDEIIAAVERSGRILQVGFVSRGAPAAAAARRAVEAGRLGRIYHAKASLYRRRGIPGLGRWFTTKSRSGGGVLIDVGVHLIDLALWLMGHPAAHRVSAHCTSHFGQPPDRYAFTEMWAGPPDLAGTFDVEDHVTALIRLAGGATLELNVTWAADLPAGALPDSVVLLGDRGGCAIDIWQNTMTLAVEQDGTLFDQSATLPPGDAWEHAWTRQYEHFARCVTERTPPPATAAHGRIVQSIVDAIYLSSDEGREVEVFA